MRGKGFLKYIVIIIVILVVVFLSQGGNLFKKGNSFTFINGSVDNAIEQAQAYIGKGSSWLMNRVFPNIAGEVEKRGEMIKEGVEQQKEKISETVGEKIQNYFSGITDSVLHPGENNNNNNNCQSQTTQTTSSGQ